MRLRELHLIEDNRSTLGLHPHMTVVAGLSPTARDWMTYAVGALLRGEDCGLAARVEDDGVTAHIGATGGADPILPRGVEVVVRSADLAHLVAMASTAGAPAKESDLGRALGAHQSAAASAAAVREALENCRSEHQAAVEAVGQIELAIEHAHRDLDPYAASAREVAVRQAALVEEAFDLGHDACRADTLDSAKDRVVHLEDRLRDLSDTLELVESVEVDRLAATVDLVRIVTATGPIPVPEAERLAHEWRAVSEHLSAIEARFASAYGGVPAMTERLEAARVRVARCDTQALPEPADPDMVTKLEAAHDLVLEAERKASGRLAGARARRAFDAALVEEQEILERLGFRTWSAWIMGESMLNSSEERRLAVEAARADFEAASRAWEQLRSELAADPEFSALLDRLERLLQATHELVGEVDDPAAALRSLRMDPGPPPIGVAEARVALVEALTAAGFDVDERTPLDDLRLVAERWLAEVRAAEALSRQLRYDHAATAAELEEAKGAFARIEALGRVLDPPETGIAEAVQARDAISGAEMRLDRHRRAITRLVHLAAECAGVSERERQLRQEQESKQELLEVVELGANAALARLRAVEAQTGQTSDPVAAILGELGRVIDGKAAAAGRPVPIVFEDVFAGLPQPHLGAALAFLEDRASRHQIIYVSDQGAVLEWAGTRDPARVEIGRGTGFFG